MIRTLFSTVLAFILLGELALSSLAAPPKEKTLAPLGSQEARKAPDWVQNGVMYQVNTRAFTPEGTIKAALDKLPVLQKAGVTIIYFCPLFLADDDMRQQFWSPRQIKSKLNNPRNPYRMKDYDVIDPEYGTEDDARLFVQTAHKLGMRVIFDLVFLHCGPTASLLKTHPEYFLYKDGKLVTTHWQFPKFDFTRQDTREYFYHNMEHWVRNCDVDGYRCDVSDDIPLDFWEEARRRLEKIKPDVSLLAEGQRQTDQLFAFDMNYSFSFYRVLNSVYTLGKPAFDIRKICERMAAERPKGYRFIRYIDNHDISNDDYENRKDKQWGIKGVDAALVLLYSLDGVPMLYCGQEIADVSRHSLYGSRKFGNCIIDWSRLHSQVGRDRLALCKKLADLRADHPAFTTGTTQWLDNSSPDQILSFIRQGKEKICLLVNVKNSPAKATIKGLPTRTESIFCKGVAKDGKGTFHFEPYGYMILVSKDNSNVVNEFRIDFNDPEMAAAIKACSNAKMVDGTLHVDIPQKSGRRTQMVNFPLNALMKQFCGYYVEIEADIRFSEVSKPLKDYFGVKFQFHLPGKAISAWPSVLQYKGSYPVHGTSDWFHSRASCEWSNKITSAFLQVGLQDVTGHFAIKNIVLRRGRPCTVSTLALPVIPQAKYSGSQPPRMRGVMSPSTSKGPNEKDFADLEKWGANLIRWQMGLPALKNGADLRKCLAGRFKQLETVLEYAKRYNLYVVIDVHTMKESRPVVLGTPDGRDELVRFWVEIAKKFKGNPNIFGYNLMNEPVSNNIEANGPSLNEQYHRLIKAIREVDPHTPIILDCDKAGVPEMLEYLEVFPYDNIIYSPHMYKPFNLTHQPNRKQGKYLSYPNTEKGWNKDFLRKELASVREFQLKTGARIYIGEFSCIRWTPGAENFIRDCIEIFEEYGWDWSYHAFREWQGWSVEHIGPPEHPKTSDSNPRRDVLLEGFRKND